MRDISLGQYYPASSVIHRMDPRAKILMSIAYIVMIFFIRSYTGYLLIALSLGSVIIISQVPFKLVFKSIKPILFLIVFTGILNLFFYSDVKPTFQLLGFFEVTDKIFGFKLGYVNFGLSWSSINNAAKMALRLLFLVMGPSLLTLTTTPVTLTDGIESLLKPLRIVRFPVHEFALIMSIALRLIPTIMEETDKIMLAQKARCADFDSGNLFKKAKALLPVLIPLFVSSLRRAEELAYAMDSRCYKGSKGRTKMKELKLSARDVIGVLAMSVLFFAILLIRYNWWALPFIAVLV